MKIALLFLLSSSPTDVWAQNIATFATVGINPRGIAFDSNGNLFVASSGSSSISRITPGGGVVNNSYITGTGPISIAFDSVGNMYASDFGQSIWKYDSSGILINATFGGQLGFYPMASNSTRLIHCMFMILQTEVFVKSILLEFWMPLLLSLGYQSLAVDYHLLMVFIIFYVPAVLTRPATLMLT